MNEKKTWNLLKGVFDMASQDRNNPTSLIWAFLIVAFIVISYMFPNFPRQVFRVAVGGIENIVMGLVGAVGEETANMESIEGVETTESTEVIASIYPQNVDTLFGACSYDLMSSYTPFEPMLVSKLNGITILTDTSMLATRVTKLPQGASITVIGDGVCMSGSGWWPVKIIEDGEAKSGWAMGGKMTAEGSVEFYFAKH